MEDFYEKILKIRSVSNQNQSIILRLDEVINEKANKVVVRQMEKHLIDRLDSYTLSKSFQEFIVKTQLSHSELIKEFTENK